MANITFLCFLLFLMYEPLHVAVKACINYRFLHICFIYISRVSQEITVKTSASIIIIFVGVKPGGLLLIY